MKNYYYTSSLNICAWLIANEFKVVKTVKLDNVIIYFNRTEDLEECIERYNKNTELKKFISAFKETKRIVKEIL